MKFDPDAFLAEDRGFDPDAFLAEDRGFDPDVFLAGDGGASPGSAVPRAELRGIAPAPPPGAAPGPAPSAAPSPGSVRTDAPKLPGAATEREVGVRATGIRTAAAAKPKQQLVRDAPRQSFRGPNPMAMGNYGTDTPLIDQAEKAKAQQAQDTIMRDVVGPRVDDIRRRADERMDAIPMPPSLASGAAGPFSMATGQNQAENAQFNRGRFTEALKGLVEEARTYIAADVEAPISYRVRAMTKGRDVFQAIPFSPAALMKAVELDMIERKVQEGGTLTEYEEARRAQYAADKELRAAVGQTIGTDIFEGIAQTLPYIAEFMVMAPAAAAARGVRAPLTVAARKMAVGGMGRKATMAAGKGLAGLAAGVTRAALNPDTAAMAIENHLRKVVPDMTTEDAMAVSDAGEGTPWAQAIINAAVIQTAEMIGEESGATIAKALSRIPGAERFMRAITFSSLRKALPNAPTTKIVEFMGRLGKQSFAEEWTEERYSALLREAARYAGVLRDDEPLNPAATFGRLLYNDTREFLTEMGVLAGAQAASGAPLAAAASGIDKIRQAKARKERLRQINEYRARRQRVRRDGESESAFPQTDPFEMAAFIRAESQPPAEPGGASVDLTTGRVALTDEQQQAVKVAQDGVGPMWSMYLQQANGDAVEAARMAAEDIAEADQEAEFEQWVQQQQERYGQTAQVKDGPATVTVSDRPIEPPRRGLRFDNAERARLGLEPLQDEQGAAGPAAPAEAPRIAQDAPGAAPVPTQGPEAPAQPAGQESPVAGAVEPVQPSARPRGETVTGPAAQPAPAPTSAAAPVAETKPPPAAEAVTPPETETESETKVPDVSGGATSSTGVTPSPEASAAPAPSASADTLKSETESTDNTRRGRQPVGEVIDTVAFMDRDISSLGSDIGYVEVQRPIGGGRVQWEAYGIDGKRLATGGGVTAISEKLSRRVGRYRNVIGGTTYRIPEGKAFSMEWLRGEMQKHDADMNRLIAEDAGRQAEADYPDLAPKAEPVQDAAPAPAPAPSEPAGLTALKAKVRRGGKKQKAEAAAETPQAQPASTVDREAKMRAESAASRFRPREKIVFEKPYIGPSGSSLIAYEWKWMPEEYVDQRGEDRVKRVSNWDDAELNEETGRMIVHQFVVKSTDGSTQTVSAETALQLLGYQTKTASGSLPSLVSSVKTLARLRMERDQLTAQMEAEKKIADDVEALPLPETTEDTIQLPIAEAGPQAGRTRTMRVLRMGDAKVWLHDGPANKERMDTVTWAWRSNRSKERGSVADWRILRDQIKDRDRRIGQQEAKIKAINEASAKAAETPPPAALGVTDALSPMTVRDPDGRRMGVLMPMRVAAMGEGDMLAGQPRGVTRSDFAATLADETRAVPFAGEGVEAVERYEDADEMVKAAVESGEGRAARWAVRLQSGTVALAGVSRQEAERSARKYKGGVAYEEGVVGGSVGVDSSNVSGGVVRRSNKRMGIPKGPTESVSTVAYHGTPDTFDRFESSGLGNHFGTAAAAEDAARQKGGRTIEYTVDQQDDEWWVWDDRGGDGIGPFATQSEAQAKADSLPPEIPIIRVRLSMENAIRMPDMGQWKFAMVGRFLWDNGYITKAEYERAFGEWNQERALQDLLVRKGYDGIVYTNEQEDKGSDSYIVFDTLQDETAARFSLSRPGWMEWQTADGQTAYGKMSRNGTVRAVTIGRRSWFFLDRYDNLSQLREDIREEAGHRLVNELGGREWSGPLGIGQRTYRGAWGETVAEIKRNYRDRNGVPLQEGTDAFNHELVAKAFRDGRQNVGLMRRFLDAVVAAFRRMARHLGYYVGERRGPEWLRAAAKKLTVLEMTDAEVRDFLRRLLEAKARGVERARAAGRNGETIRPSDAMQQAQAAQTFRNPAVTPEMDREYMAAVEAGDTEKAQRMVDEAAKKAGYRTSSYHGTSLESRFSEFQIPSQGTSSNAFGSWKTTRWGAFFTPSKAFAKEFAEQGGRRGRVDRFRLALGKTLDLVHPTQKAYDDLVSNGINSRFLDQYIYTPSANQWELFDEDAGGGKPVVDAMRASGYDSAKFVELDSERNERLAYAVFSPSQIKSADPVTRDDAGNAIPLSERFNPGSPDIRFAKGPPPVPQSQPRRDPTRTEAELMQSVADAQRGQTTAARVAQAVEQSYARQGLERLRAKEQARRAEQAKRVAERTRTVERRAAERAATSAAGVPPALPPRPVAASVREAAKTAAAKASELGEAKGREKAIKEAQIELRKAIARADRMARKEERERLLSLKKEIVKAVRDAIPGNERGRYLMRVATAKTAADVQRAAVAIDKHMDEIHRNRLVLLVKKAFQDAIDAPGIAVDYVRRIKQVMGDILLKKPTQATLDRLTATRDYIAREKAAGNDVELPGYILEELTKLQGKVLAKMESAELEDLLVTIQTLAKLGRTKLLARRAVDRAMKDRDIDDMKAQGITPFNDADIINREPGKVLTVSEAMHNAYAKSKTAVEKWYKWHLPMDVVADVFDGGNGYKGVTYRVFRTRFNRAFANYRNAMLPFQNELAEKIKQYGIKRSEAERIGAYAVDQQDSGRQKLVNTFARNESDVERVNAFMDNLKLTPNEMAFYDWMRDWLDRVRPAIAEVMKVNYNVDLSEQWVDNYFPFMTDWDIMQNDVLDGYTIDDAGNVKKKNPEMGFTKARRGAGRQAVQVDAVRVLEKHMSDVFYLIHTAATTKYLGELAKNPEIRDLYGIEGQRMLVDYVDVLSRKGGVGGAHVLRWADVLRRNVGIGTLGFRLSSVLIQPTSLIDAFGMVGPTWGLRGATNIATSREWREFVMKNMSEVRDRVGDDWAFIEMGGGRLARRVTKIGYWPLEKFDQLTAATVAAAAYERNLHERGLTVDMANPDKEAIEYAQLMVRRTQASGAFKDIPLAVSRGYLVNSPAFAKWLYQFNTFITNKWSMLSHDALGLSVGKRDYAKAANILLWSTMAFAAEEGIRFGLRAAEDAVTELLTGIPPDDDDDEEMSLAGASKEIGLDYLATVPVFGQLVGMFKYGDFVPTPVLSTLTDIGKGTYRFLTGKKPMTKARGGVMAAGAVGSAAGIPGTSQAAQWLRKLMREQAARRAPARRREPGGLDDIEGL